MDAWVAHQSAAWYAPILVLIRLVVGHQASRFDALMMGKNAALVKQRFVWTAAKVCHVSVFFNQMVTFRVNVRHVDEIP